MERRRSIRKPPITIHSEELKLEATKAMTPTIIESVKVLILVNGGAIVTLISQYKELRELIEPQDLQRACFFFVFGLILACCSSFFYWMAQAHRDGSFKRSSDGREPPKFIQWSPMCMYFGIASFAAGALWIISSMK